MKTVTNIALSYDENAIANILGHNENISIECWDIGAIFRFKNNELICELNDEIIKRVIVEDITPNNIKTMIGEAYRNSKTNKQPELPKIEKI